LHLLNYFLLSSGFTAGTPKFLRNFDPSVAEVVRSGSNLKDAIIAKTSLSPLKDKKDKIIYLFRRCHE